MNPMNPSLFRALERVFERVEIVNEGQRAHVSYTPDWSRKGKLNITIGGGGEYYKIACPFCKDYKLRLWISYLWGTKDSRTGQPLLHPINCFNEDCIRNRERQEEFHDLLFHVGMYRRGAPVPTPTKVTAEESPPPPVKARLPDHCEPLGELPRRHAARLYLEERGFDLDEIWKSWNVYYCAENLDQRPHFHDRLVIPIYRPPTCLELQQRNTRSVLAGWQARTLEAPAKDNPKYLTMQGMHKSRLLYGLPAAIKTDRGPIVLVEGVTDVWRLDTNAVAIFGKSLSTSQLALLLHHFPGREIVVALDADAALEAGQVWDSLRSARAILPDDTLVIVVRPPAGRKDVGECDREEIWKKIHCSVKGRHSQAMPGLVIAFRPVL